MSSFELMLMIYYICTPVTGFGVYWIRHFQNNFHVWKCLHFDTNGTIICSKDPDIKMPAVVQITAWHRSGLVCLDYRRTHV